MRSHCIKFTEVGCRSSGLHRRSLWRNHREAPDQHRSEHGIDPMKIGCKATNPKRESRPPIDRGGQFSRSRSRAAFTSFHRSIMSASAFSSPVSDPSDCRGLRLPPNPVPSGPSISGISRGDRRKRIEFAHGGSERSRLRAHTKWRFAKARPEPLFRYFSNATALEWLANSNETINRQGRCRAVCRDPPEL